MCGTYEMSGLSHIFGAFVSNTLRIGSTLATSSLMAYNALIVDKTVSFAWPNKPTIKEVY